MLERFEAEDTVETLMFNGPLLDSNDEDVLFRSHKDVPMSKTYEEALKLYMGDPHNVQAVTTFLNSSEYKERNGPIVLSEYLVTPQEDDVALSA